MRILAITNCYPRPGHPTNAMFSYLQLRALARLHDVRTIVPIAWPDRFRERTRAPSEIESNGMRLYYPTYWFTPKILQSHYGTFFLRSIRRTVDRILKDFSPEAVLAVWAHPDGWAAVKIARELSIPAFIKVIGSDVLVLGRHQRRRGRIADALQKADGVVAVSHDLAKHVVSMGVDSAKVHVVSEGTDTVLFQPGDQSEARSRLGLSGQGRILIFVGNLLFSKGAGLVIEACALLRDQAADFTCYLLGGGKDEAKLRRGVARLDLSDRVLFAGRLPQDRLPDWYRASDVVTLPSYSEGIPNVLREAMCCGRPFVATRVGGIPEISPPECSRLVERGDVSALAAALREMLAAPPRVDPRTVSSYVTSWEQSAAMIGNHIHAAVAAGNMRDCGKTKAVSAPQWEESISVK
jgi:glycosyltransferase involved in cell wall biosynthesis